MPSILEYIGGGVTGELIGVVAATQLPNIPCKMVAFKTPAGNSGGVYLGFTSGVTVSDGATDTTTGWVLEQGEETGWIPIGNLNKLYRICDGTGDTLIYMALY